MNQPSEGTRDVAAASEHRWKLLAVGLAALSCFFLVTSLVDSSEGVWWAMTALLAVGLTLVAGGALSAVRHLASQRGSRQEVASP